MESQVFAHGLKEIGCLASLNGNAVVYSSLARFLNRRRSRGQVSLYFILRHCEHRIVIPLG